MEEGFVYLHLSVRLPSLFSISLSSLPPTMPHTQALMEHLLVLRMGRPGL